jgi:hypothetical protein
MRFVLPLLYWTLTVGVLAVPGTSFATSITFGFTGVVTSGIEIEGRSLSHPLGTPISGTYTFDPDTPDIEIDPKDCPVPPRG